MSRNPSLDGEIDATDEFVATDCNGIVLPGTSLYLRIRRSGCGRTQKNEKNENIFGSSGRGDLEGVNSNPIDVSSPGPAGRRQLAHNRGAERLLREENRQ